MASGSQRRAAAEHRRRTAARGLVRLEVQAATIDTALIRALAEALRGEPERAGGLRAKLREALRDSGAITAFDIFGSELPDEAFSGVFEHGRDQTWHDIDL